MRQRLWRPWRDGIAGQLPRKEKLADVLPGPVLAAFAQALARRPRLEHFPGWTFDAGERAGGDRVEWRRAVWRSAARRSVPVRIVVPWYGDLRLALYLGSDLSRTLFVGGFVEPNELVALSGLLSPGMVVMDAGANAGIYTVFAARRVGPGGRVIAVEPSSRDRERLHENLRLNRLRNVGVVPVALGAARGTATLAIAEGAHEGQNALGDRIANAAVRRERTETVELSTLDRLVEQHALTRLDFVKADVEGGELALLQGGEASLRRFRPVIQLELNEAALRLQGAGRRQLQELLGAWGYRLLAFGPAGAPVPAGDLERIEGNIVAVPAERPRSGVGADAAGAGIRG